MLVLALLAAPALAGWREDVAEVAATRNATRFHEIVAPVASLVNQTYTASEGCTYFDPDHERWVPAPYYMSLKHDPADGGMRAFFFESGAPSDADYRGVVAFRGTDLGPGDTPSVRADACADALLAFEPLPDYCVDFGKDVLDYYESAISFVRDQVLEVRGADANILYSGHSLGALLAALVVETLTRDGQRPVALVFSSPGFDAAAEARGVNATIAEDALVALADANDPVYFMARGNLTGATACTFATADDESCDTCFARDPREGDEDPACVACFERHHIYGHYLRLLASEPLPDCAS